METILKNVHEIAGVRTIFPNSKGEPVLHMHASCGRAKKSIAGYVRRGVKTWHIIEIILWEIETKTAKRLLDKTIGFELLVP